MGEKKGYGDYFLMFLSFVPLTALSLFSPILGYHDMTHS